jgi:hypothetical protein
LTPRGFSFATAIQIDLHQHCEASYGFCWTLVFQSQKQETDVKQKAVIALFLLMVS